MTCRGGGSGSFVSLRYVTVITLYVYVIFDVDLKAMFMLFYVYDVYLIMLQEVVPRVKHNVLLHHSYIILLYLCYSCSFSDRFPYRLSMRNKHSGMEWNGTPPPSPSRAWKSRTPSRARVKV